MSGADDSLLTPGPEREATIARMVFETLDAGIVVQGPLGKVAVANPAAARILGVELDAMIGHRIEDLIGPFLRPDRTPMTSEELPGRRAFSTGVAQLEVLIGVAEPDGGGSRWFEVSASPLLYGELVFAVVSSIRDVTARQRAEEALRDAERRQRIVLEHAVGGYAIVADDGRVLDGSASLASWLARRDGRVVHDLEAMHPDDRRPVQRLIEQATASAGAPARAELRAVDPQGETYWIELTATDQRADPAVGGVVVNFTEITERKRAEQALAHQARHDPVTGLPNRRLLTDRLEQALSRAERRGSHVAVLFYDVDHFKIVNDSLGHPAGDAVLQELAGRFRVGAREADTVVRFGGDEFVIVCEDIDGIDQALEIASRLTALAEEPLHIDRNERIVTVSAGVAISSPGVTSSMLLRDADAAMNHAKERGRARTEVFSGDLRNRATRRLDLDSALRRSLDHDELRLVYQPVVALDTGRSVGCEALLRWDHPEHGAISPDEFIPLAERSGMIVAIGAWVLDQALAQLAAWVADGSPDELWMAVNISARQLADPDLVSVITAALDRTGVAPTRLHLEVTESVLIDDLATTIERLDQLQSLGVHIDVDDFGTGYSSLSYLKRLPINTLKIDRSFTDGLGTDPHDTSIVHAIISLARALDLDVIAEGVETATQRSELERLGCDLGQGYHWSRPLAPEDLRAWLLVP